MHGALRKPALQHSIRLAVTECRPARHSASVIGLDARDAITQARKLPCAASGSRHDQNPSVTSEPMTKSECSLYVLVNVGHSQESTGTFPATLSPDHDAASDQTILSTSANLYGSYSLKRVYYLPSADSR
jgi:hypothetical protein